MALSPYAAIAIAAGLLTGACGHERSSAQATRDSDVGLHFNAAGPVATLAYGRANSDDVGLMLQCVSGSGQVDVSDVARGARNQLSLNSGDTTANLASRVDTTTGQPTLWAQTDIDAPVLAAFRRSGRIGVISGGGRYKVAATAGEMVGVRRFFSACKAA